MMEPTEEDKTLPQIIGQISNIVDPCDVVQMINVQMSAIERLENTNKSIANCVKMSQDKLSSTSKLFQKTAKQLNESKRDLDIIYRKICDLKARIKSERPDLIPSPTERCDTHSEGNTQQDINRDDT